MPVIKSDYQKPFYLPNCHFETIIPALFRKVPGVPYQRERITLEDGDFLDLDWAHQYRSRSLAIITHGLEGDTMRGYVKGMAKKFYTQGWSALAWNHRGCSGEPNRLRRFYHSGSTEDLRAVVNHALQTGRYDQIALIGFSLGGNMTLKYLGEEAEQAPREVHKAVVYSVPLHLSSCSASLREARNWIYAQRFKQDLSHKVKQKASLMPNDISAAHLSKIRTLKDFDNYYTAPLHGFEDAEDYYTKSSSIHYVEKIVHPTLIVNAQNDPFLAPPCFPFELFEKLEHVYFEAPSTGGHCGFTAKHKEGFYWSELRAWDFVNA